MAMVLIFLTRRDLFYFLPWKDVICRYFFLTVIRVFFGTLPWLCRICTVMSYIHNCGFIFSREWELSETSPIYHAELIIFFGVYVWKFIPTGRFITLFLGINVNLPSLCQIGTAILANLILLPTLNLLSNQWLLKGVCMRIHDCKLA